MTKVVLGGVLCLTLGDVAACSRLSDDDSGGAKAGSGGKGGTGGTTSTGGTGMGGTGGGAAVDANACPAFTACGGDVTGSWKVQTFCGAISVSSNADCAGEVVGETLGGDNGYVFGQNGSLSVSGSITVTADLVIDAACATASAGASVSKYCAELNAAYSTPVAGQALPITFDCAVHSDLCDCTVVEGPLTEASGSNYTITGNQIALGGAKARDYCVTGDTLTLDASSDTTSAISFLTLARQ